MKKFLVLICMAVFFIACDYASESMELKPDIEVVYMNPIGLFVMGMAPEDSVIPIEEIKIVAENSVDCYLRVMVAEYYDVNDIPFFGPIERTYYAKIRGIVDETCVDTTTLSIFLPLLTPMSRMIANNQHEAKIMLRFIAIDEYWGTKEDTSDAWFSLYVDY